jgi:hypothetical protein
MKNVFTFFAILAVFTVACEDEQCNDYDSRCGEDVIQHRCSNENSEADWYDYHDCFTTDQTCAMVQGEAQCADGDSGIDIGIGELVVSTNLSEGGWVIYACPAEEGEDPSPIHQGPPAPHTGDQETPYTMPANFSGVCYYIAFMPESGYDIPGAQTIYLISDETKPVFGDYTPD